MVFQERKAQASAVSLAQHNKSIYFFFREKQKKITSNGHIFN